MMIIYYNNLDKNIEIFLKILRIKILIILKMLLSKPLIKYCENQSKFYNSISKLVDFLNPNCVFVDQLRFDISTILASISLSKKRKLFLFLMVQSLSLMINFQILFYPYAQED